MKRPDANLRLFRSPFCAKPLENNPLFILWPPCFLGLRRFRRPGSTQQHLPIVLLQWRILSPSLRRPPPLPPSRVRALRRRRFAQSQSRLSKSTQAVCESMDNKMDMVR
ncbi:hypothetical protein PAHAL_3G170100 [Panicum hallii]|uniref:Uncharacterized protein n=1 Tax=Panicum hallii TaxID=206008 RepID=A0A2T8KII8_9POAL|nr:hypothetical protein PAHAL_3G170100 [Panicum hallii]